MHKILSSFVSKMVVSVCLVASLAFLLSDIFYSPPLEKQLEIAFTSLDEQKLDEILTEHGLANVETVLGVPLLFWIQQPWIHHRVSFSRVALNHGADINANYHGDTALMVAAMWGRLESVEFLLSHGADKYVEGSNGEIAYDLLPSSDGKKNDHKLAQLLKRKG